MAARVLTHELMRRRQRLGAADGDRLCRHHGLNGDLRLRPGSPHASDGGLVVHRHRTLRSREVSGAMVARTRPRRASAARAGPGHPPTCPGHRVILRIPEQNRDPRAARRLLEGGHAAPCPCRPPTASACSASPRRSSGPTSRSTSPSTRSSSISRVSSGVPRSVAARRDRHALVATRRRSTSTPRACPLPSPRPSATSRYARSPRTDASLPREMELFDLLDELLASGAFVGAELDLHGVRAPDLVRVLADRAVRREHAHLGDVAHAPWRATPSCRGTPRSRASGSRRRRRSPRGSCTCRDRGGESVSGRNSVGSSLLKKPFATRSITSRSRSLRS